MNGIQEIKIEKINKNRFDIFMLFTRHPNINFIAKEIEYYANKNNSILGVILFDYTDKDYNYVLMARDENKQFRAFEIKTDYKTKEIVTEMIINSMKWHTSQNLEIVSQGVSKQGLKLFNIVVEQNKLHPYFIRLNNSKALEASKKTIIEISNHMNDIDGNFIEQFQSVNGFDARIWELYLFASLIELEFEILREHERPDFIVKKNDIQIAIEAVIVSRKNNPATFLNTENPIKPDEIKEKLKNEMPLRFGSTLFSKLNKKYWEIEHIKGKPLVFAIADFHDNASMIWSFNAIIEYLYGSKQTIITDENGKEKVVTEKVDDYIKENGTLIPSGFFSVENSENISAILFSSTGTLAKFTRMGVQAGFKVEKQTVIRIGDKYDHKPDTFVAKSFSYLVDENCNEKWSEGLNLFHNPNAKLPIDMDLFPMIAHHKLEGDELISWTPDFHPFSSININTVVTD